MQSPDHPPASAGRWVSFDQARMLLSLPGHEPPLSEGTLRRAIKTGKVEAGSFPRNPDNLNDKRSVYLVLVPDLPEQPPASPVASEAPSANEAATEPPAATTRALEIVSAALESERAERQILSAEIRNLTERAARAETRAEAAEARATFLEAELERERRPWWRKMLGRE
jgi:hypothetical protein